MLIVQQYCLNAVWKMIMYLLTVLCGFRRYWQMFTAKRQIEFESIFTQT